LVVALFEQLADQQRIIAALRNEVASRKAGWPNIKHASGMDGLAMRSGQRALQRLPSFGQASPMLAIGMCWVTGLVNCFGLLNSANLKVNLRQIT